MKLISGAFAFIIAAFVLLLAAAFVLVAFDMVKYVVSGIRGKRKEAKQ